MRVKHAARIRIRAAIPLNIIKKKVFIRHSQMKTILVSREISRNGNKKEDISHTSHKPKMWYELKREPEECRKVYYFVHTTICSSAILVPFHTPTLKSIINTILIDSLAHPSTGTRCLFRHRCNGWLFVLRQTPFCVCACAPLLICRSHNRL